MSSETAQTVLVIICVVAAVVWLTGLWFLLSSFRSGSPASGQMEEDFGSGESPSKDWARGRVEIEAPIQGLADKAAAALVKLSSGAISVSDKTQDRLSFKRVGPPMAGLPERGEIQLSSLGSNRTQADYAIEQRGYVGLLWGGAIFQALGLIALVAGGWAVYEYCVLSPNPELRAQSLQMIQICHFLWPPFLFGGLYRARRRIQVNQMWFLLRNLPQQV